MSTCFMCDVPCDEIVNIPQWDYANACWTSRAITMCLTCAKDNEATCAEYIKIMNDLLRN